MERWVGLTCWHGVVGGLTDEVGGHLLGMEKWWDSPAKSIRNGRGSLIKCGWGFENERSGNETSLPQLTAEWRCPEQDSVEHSRTTAKHTQFKVSDRTVQLFAKGTSKAVL